MAVSGAALTPDLVHAIGAAVRQVVTAVSASHGADCLLYALVGARLLARRGVPARAVAGSAAWRIGPGDGDVLSHAHEISGPRFAPAPARDAEGRPTVAGMFHAWILMEPPAGGVAAPMLLDLTTWQLARKARELDLADGRTTTVTWCPELLWARASSGRPFREVAQAAAAGVYGYVRHAAIERLVYTDAQRDDAEALAEAAWLALEARLAGREFRVLGTDPGADVLGHAGPS